MERSRDLLVGNGERPESRMGLTEAEGKGGWIRPCIHHFPSAMAQSFWNRDDRVVRLVFVVTVVVSLATKAKPARRA